MYIIFYLYSNFTIFKTYYQKYATYSFIFQKYVLFLILFVFSLYPFTSLLICVYIYTNTFTQAYIQSRLNNRDGDDVDLQRLILSDRKSIQNQICNLWNFDVCGLFLVTKSKTCLCKDVVASSNCLIKCKMKVQSCFCWLWLRSMPSSYSSSFLTFFHHLFIEKVLLL